MKWFGLLFQDSMSQMMMVIDDLHSFYNETMLVILIFVFLMMAKLMWFSWYNSSIHEFSLLEAYWTVLPMVFLFSMAFPTLWSIYYMEMFLSPDLTTKVIGNQWFWSYEVPEFDLKFDSYMKPLDSLSEGDFRLLEVDNALELPINTGIRVIVTSSDVIHSWAVPALGVKIDANPGRLNQVFMRCNFPQVLFGTCSEICGSNHSFMPIETSFFYEDCVF